ncbi:GNAT family N-acetyltransferase [Homoserinibacter sp. YIM 151385]|uniref:GNAT family N-acetyltransferase n=1 Tax=Homoserinibacter sp. YIM 151385 TaxID=2985506 RepID=UPI0022F0C100|nr:GNAT family protein [Homoserinibacter sp. YIM 151385]WBU39113.1 GNAT family protein [Homoserinibacter sp. YIM 151385]
MDETYPFTSLPVLETARMRLEPLGPAHFDDVWTALHEPETLRLTGTHETFSEDRIRAWLRDLPGTPHRADWAIVEAHTEEYLGEVVLNDLDAHNSKMGFRIALAGPAAFGRGYGTEAARAVVDHGFDRIGLHRIELEVYAFNRRARRSYEKVGFVEEGRMRDALLWEGEWADAILMSVLSSDPRPR